MNDLITYVWAVSKCPHINMGTACQSWKEPCIPFHFLYLAPIYHSARYTGSTQHILHEFIHIMLTLLQIIWHYWAIRYIR